MTDTYTDATATEAGLANQLEQARQKREALEREAAARAVADHLAVYQKFLDDYDPAALRQAVVDTWDACVAAAAGRTRGSLSARIAENLAAILREWRLTSLAAEAVGRGAVPRDGLKIPPAHAKDAKGNAYSEDIMELIPKLHAQAIYEAADAPSRGEVAGVAQRAADAHASALLAPPSGYRIVSAGRGDWVDSIAGHAVTFIGGVAYAMREDLSEDRLAAMVRYWRSLPETYEVTEVYGPVPADHRAALSRVA